jgi:hypothetical protein
MFGGLPGSKQKIGQSFPRGTVLCFWQAAAPLGWTKLTTQNDKLLRIVSGAGGPTGGGGANPFSTVNAQTVVGSTTISTTTMPSHVHADGFVSVGGSGPNSSSCNGPAPTAQGNTGATGGGGAHNHSLTMSIQFIDLILASRN